MATKKYCPKCGIYESSSLIYCPHCGDELVEIKSFYDEWFEASDFSLVYQNLVGEYSDECPIIIISEYIFTDKRDGQQWTRIVLKNIGNKQVMNCTVVMAFKLFSGESITKAFFYSGINAGFNVVFGDDVVHRINVNNIEKVECKVIDITFDLFTTWEDKNYEWKNLPSRQRIFDELDDHKIEQYVLNCGTDAIYVPKKQGKIVMCTCGELFYYSLEKCPSCSRLFRNAFAEYDLYKLEREWQKNIEQSLKHAISLNGDNRVDSNPIDERKYIRAVELYKEANSDTEYRRCLNLLKEIKNYKDSAQYIIEVENVLFEKKASKEIKKESHSTSRKNDRKKASLNSKEDNRTHYLNHFILYILIAFVLLTVLHWVILQFNSDALVSSFAYFIPWMGILYGTVIGIAGRKGLKKDNKDVGKGKICIVVLLCILFIAFLTFFEYNSCYAYISTGGYVVNYSYEGEHISNMMSDGEPIGFKKYMDMYYWGATFTIPQGYIGNSDDVIAPCGIIYCAQYLVIVVSSAVSFSNGNRKRKR